MARPLRVNLAGGWYHITNRGNNRGVIFRDKRDRAHFLNLLEEMRDRYGVRVYAYVLMSNHYHLLIGTPEANASRAIQWLNVAYSVWHNRRHGLSGHLFQGRFKAILVEGSEWGLELSAYIHLNPVAVKCMGLGKRERTARKIGAGESPSPEQVERRLAELRGYAWSSYKAYAGYENKPKWLDSMALLDRVGNLGGGREQAYRELVEERVRQGVEERPWERLKWGIVLGGERFARMVRGRIRVNGESQGQRELRKRFTFEELVKKVERIRGMRWEEFQNRHGDWGRDLVLWAGRRYSGLTLAELGAKVGGIHYTTVLLATKRLDVKSRSAHDVRRAMRRLGKECNMSRCDPQ